MIIFLAVSLALLCVLAAAMEVQCMNHARIPDNTLSKQGRMVLIAGFVVNALRVAYILAFGEPTFELSGLMAQAMIVLGNVVRCANSLYIASQRPLQEAQGTIWEYDKTAIFKMTSR